jgi:pimeloyl-ACP methyl ester carboxylesterase
MSSSVNRREAGALSLAAVFGMGVPSAKAQGGPRPGNAQGKTYVMVHGAWYGGWVWGRVAPLLRAKGHAVSTPTLPGLGELRHLVSKEINLTTFVNTIVHHIEHENLNDVVLVASGFSGIVILAVADRIPERLKKLVFVNALVIPSGTSAFSEQPAAITKARLEQVEAFGGGIAIPPAPIATYKIKDPQVEKWAADRLAMHPVGTYQENLMLKNLPGNGRPLVYIDCVASPFPPLVDIKKRLKQQGGWQWHELNANHDPMVSEPEMLATVLLEM